MKNLLAFTGYPMLCRIKKTQTGFDKATNIISGTIALEFSDDEACNPGDMLVHGKAEIVVNEVLESRPARGKHKIPAIWNKVQGEYTELYAGTK